MINAEFLPLSDDGIPRLAESVPPLSSGEEFAFDPRFFLASISKRQWTPRVVVVRENRRVLGYLYAKERRVANFNTGILYADGSLISSVLANPGDRARVLHTALRFLFSRPGVRALRMLVPPGDPDLPAVQEALSCRDVDVYRSDMNTYHSRLALASDYDEFLARLGKKTRRNFRYYRRHFEAAGGRYLEHVTLDEFTSAAHQLDKKSCIPVNPDSLQRFLRMMAVVQRPFMPALRGPDGQWLAILGGWHSPHSTMVFLQLNNDRDHPQDSLSVVLRGYVIEALIARGMQEVLFWAGSSAPLSWHCSPVPAVAIYLDARTPLWRSFRYAAARVASWFPKFAYPAWIAPPRAGTGLVPDAFHRRPTDT
jgi:hypothetical protein